jgi:hypothetical protein
MTSTMRRAATALGAACALVVGVAPTATAGASDTIVEGALASYEASGLVLLVGPPMQHGCFGQDLIEDQVHIIEAPSGNSKEFTKYDERMFLFEAPSIGAVVGGNCDAIANDEVWPYPPVASGYGTTTNLEHYTEDGEKWINQTRGVLTDTEGDTWTVQARWQETFAYQDDGPPTTTHYDEWIRLRADNS